jgi:hypothetical protein
MPGEDHAAAKGDAAQHVSQEDETGQARDCRKT